MIYFDTFTKMAKNVGDLGKFIVAKVFKKLPKVQKIAQSGHTDPMNERSYLQDDQPHDGFLKTISSFRLFTIK